MTRMTRMTRKTRKIPSLTTLALVLATTAGAVSAQTLNKIKANGSISVAHRESSIPFCHLDDKAQPAGFGWEICQRIVDEVKKATGRTDLKVTSPPRVRPISASCAVTTRRRSSASSCWVRRSMRNRRYLWKLNVPMSKELSDNLKIKSYKPAG